ncbi:Vegetative incompatibility protein HET-E-1, partial [Trametes pubescens]
MRLLDTSTGHFHDINSSLDEPYAILSHVWNPPDAPEPEQTFQDLQAIQKKCPTVSILSDSGVSSKVRLACTVARDEGYRLLWLDSCCIDKTSSAELSEAINSMFEWYANSSICYVFLADVEDNKAPRYASDVATSHAVHGSDTPGAVSIVSESQLHLPATENDHCVSQPIHDSHSCPREADSERFTSDAHSATSNFASDNTGNSSPYWTLSLRRRFCSSRWHTRGWTLQELIAPRTVLFLSSGWNILGSKLTLSDLIEEATGVDHDVLTHKKSLCSVSVAQRMWWASGRKTTRIEDEAYCLMGLFGVNLPTVYGEGRRAFIRLQEEIFRTIPDQSIFAWELSEHYTFKRHQTDTVRDQIRKGSRPAMLERGRFDTVDGLFALSPRCFALSKGLGPIPHEDFVARLQGLIPSTTSLPFPAYTITSYGVRGQAVVFRGFIYKRSGRQHVLNLSLLECEDTEGNLIAICLGRTAHMSAMARTTIGFIVSPELQDLSKVFRIFSLPESALCSPKTPVFTIDASFSLQPSRTGLQEISRDVVPPPVDRLPPATARPEAIRVEPYHWCEALLETHGVRLHRLQTRTQTAGHSLHLFALRALASSSSNGTSPIIPCSLRSSIILCAVEVDDQRWIFGDDHIDCSVYVSRVDDFDLSVERAELPQPIYEATVKALHAASSYPLGTRSFEFTHECDESQMAVRVWIEEPCGKKASSLDQKDMEDVLRLGIDMEWREGRRQPKGDQEHWEQREEEEDLTPEDQPLNGDGDTSGVDDEDDFLFPGTFP